MSTKVSYKGAQITEVGAQQTKTLLTAGKYCEDDFTLANDDNPIAEDNDIIFIDYDGTIRYSYSADEFAALTALPPNPVHAGLTAQGWNWSLSDAKSYVGKYGELIIGQLYDTDDGTTRFYVTIAEGINRSVSLYFNQTAANGVEINWGDGSTAETLSGTGRVGTSHQYPAQGEYKISLKTISGTLSLEGGIYTNESPYYSNSKDSIAYIRAEIGSNVTVMQKAFSFCRCLQSVTLHKDITAIKGETFRFNLMLIAVTLPPFTTGGNDVFAECSALGCVSLPKSMPTLGASAFLSPQSLRRLTTPEAFDVYPNSFCHAFTSVGGTRMGALRHLTIPETVRYSYGSAFQYQSALEDVIFYRSSPCTFHASTILTDVSPNCRFYVPYSGLAAYLTATNYPSPSTYTYLCHAVYESGAVLPAKDSTNAYNITWYASKDDAAAGTNPITIGNGKRVFGTYAAA